MDFSKVHTRALSRPKNLALKSANEYDNIFYLLLDTASDSRENLAASLHLNYDQNQKHHTYKDFFSVNDINLIELTFNKFFPALSGLTPAHPKMKPISVKGLLD